MSYDISAVVDQITEDLCSRKLLPENFSYREGQKKIICDILHEFVNNDVPTVILNAPTGVGKSIIARVVAEVIIQMYNTDSLFVTQTIALQNQYLSTFPDMKRLMGATNYSCHSDTPVAIAPKNKIHETCRYHKSTGECKYEKARQEFKAAPLKNLNYAFFVTAGGIYSCEGLLVTDEAHNLASSLIDYSEVTININRLEVVTNDINMSNFLPVDKIKKDKALGLEHIIPMTHYLRDCKNLMKEALNSLNESIDNLEKCGNGDALISLVETRLTPLKKSYEYVSNVLSSLTHFMTCEPEDWVLHRDEGAERDLIFILKPLDVTPASLSLIAQPRFRLLMSATTAGISDDLLMESGDFVQIDVDYLWPLENRPVMVETGLPSMNYKNRLEVMDLYVDALDEFISGFPEDCSGVVHTSSYSNANEISKRSKFKSRLYIPESKELRDIEKIAKPGRIFVSPAMTEGIDLKGDMSSFQVIFKLSYPSLGDEWISTKKDRRPEWYDTKVLTDFIQSTGRSIRSPEDVAVTYVMDQSFTYLKRRAGHLMPQWFLDTLI